MGFDRPWRVRVPAGCRVSAATEGLIEYRCRAKVVAIERYFRERFPGGKLKATAGGFAFKPGGPPGARVRFAPVRELKRPTRLLVLRNEAPVEEAEATRIRKAFEAGPH